MIADPEAVYFIGGMVIQEVGGIPVTWDIVVGYDILLVCFGAGAVLGALTMQLARAWWSRKSWPHV